MRRVLIRVDIGGEHGMGHAVRCKALAQALQAHGAEVRFVSPMKAMKDFVAPFHCSLAPDSLANGYQWAGCPNSTLWMNEGGITLVIDTKSEAAVSPEWLRCLRHEYRYVRVVRVDHPDATPDTCDLLIAPCAHWGQETVARLRQSFGERFLYGWDYVMLDADVVQHAQVPYEQRNGIVFCAGGSDPTGALDQMYALTENLHIDAKLLFCFGAQSHGTLRQRYEVAGEESLCASDNRYAMPFHRDYLRQAAMVVTMFGQTCYELVWYRTPALCLGRSFHEQHDIVGLGNASRQSISYGGPITGITSEQLYLYFKSMLDDERILLQQKYEASAGLLDGHGVQRVAEAILQLA